MTALDSLPVLMLLDVNLPNGLLALLRKRAIVGETVSDAPGPGSGSTKTLSRLVVLLADADVAEGP